MPRRREKGQGSVYEYPKGSGRWWAKMPEDGPGSPAKWRVNSKEEGKALLREKLRERDDGLQIVGRSPTVAQWMAHYLADVVEVKATTHEDYTKVNQRNIEPYLGSIRITELRPAQVRKWVKSLSQRLARNTVRNAFVLLRAALAIAVNDRLLRYNPTDGVTLPKGNDEDVREAYALTFEEADRLLAAVEGHRLYALYYVALATGMRQGELIGLRWSNVVLNGEKPEIRVREQIRLVKYKPTFLPPKSKKSRRDIPIDDALVKVLRAHWQMQQGERERREDWQEHLLVFPSEVGTPINPRNLYRHFKGVAADAKLPDEICFHDLRHSAGSLMLANGANLVDVSNILGHSSVAVTASIYAHAYDDNKRRAVAGVAQKLRNKEGANE